MNTKIVFDNKKALDFKGSMPFLYVNATKVCGVNSLTK